MSDQRSRYSTAPLQNYKKPPRRSKAPQPPRRVGDYQDEVMAPRSFAVLQILLTIALPITFIVALLVRSANLYIAFSIVSAGSLALMWLMSAFVPNARTTLSIIHIAMILVSLFAVFIGAPPQERNRTQTQQTQQQGPAAPGTNTQGGDLQSIFNKDSSASMVGMTTVQEEPEESATQGAAVGSASQAQQQLEQFMAAWINVNYQRMVDLSLPSWVSQQKDPKQSMFQIRANRSPIDYEFNGVSGSDADSTRTVSMTTSISKNNGEPPQKYAMQVLMVRLNDVWYVDPNSLGSAQRIAETGGATQVPQVTVAPMTTSEPNMALYYNPDGGAYYHINSMCPSLKAEYLPMTASFAFHQLGEDAYKKLQPCGVCHAPRRDQ